MINLFWGKIEEVHGEEAVRLHRAIVTLSDEYPDDHIKVKQEKHRKALVDFQQNLIRAKRLLEIMRVCDQICFMESILVSIATDIPGLILSLKPLSTIKSFLSKSRGERVLEMADDDDSFGLCNFSTDTGFMGEVKVEVVCLFVCLFV